MLKRLDLLLKEIQDPHAQENFWRIKQYIESLGDGSLVGPPGPQGPQGPAGAEYWDKFTDSITSSNTLTVDTVLLSSFTRIKYFITVKGLTSGNTKGLDLTVQNDAGTLTETVTHRLGSLANISVNITDDATDMFLDINNNSVENVQVTILRATL